ETSGATLAPAPDPQTEPIQPEPPGLPVQIIVQLKLPALPPGLTAQQILEMRRQPPSPTALLELSGRVGVGLAYGRALSDGSHVLIPDQLMTPAEATELIDRLRSDPAIDQVEVDQPVRFQSVPADPEYYRLWNLHPPGAVSVGSDFETAWDLHAGSPQIVIAVIDTGVLPHPDLVGAAGTLAAGAGNLASEGYDFISDCRIRATCPATTPSSAAAVAPSPGALDRGDWISASDRAVPFFSNCSVKDSGWHGTHVAGVTSAIANNNLGIAGGAYGARLLPVRVLGKCGGYISNVAEGIRWAAGVHPTIANPVPARVLNLSLGAAGSCGTTLQAAIDAAVGAGAVVVVAAGNEGADAGASMLPSCNNVLTVTATQTLGDAAYYSNRSTTRVAIAAPGGDTRFTSTAGIFSAANTGTTVHEPGGWTYSAKQGTSMATPHVSAAAGLMLSRNPALSPQQLRTILTAPATVTPFAPATQCAAAGDCGSGILNARRAVAYSVSPLRAAPASIDFGAVAAGAAVSQSVAVLNDSSAAVAVGQLTVSGNGFALAADGCTQQTLAPGGSCSVRASAAY
ncbi:MAG TPA: S8 family serine peptidase, partial [Burkholderiaceae bacterium]|nr:S8 family serine peptidase [Burkholderiaceae bacterium]